MHRHKHLGSLPLALPLVVALLLAGCAGSSTGARGTSSPTARASASGSPTPSPSPTAYTSVNIATLGWVKLSSLAYSDALATAPGAPNTLYSCSGAANANKANGVITLSVSTDGGQSWQTTNTPALAGACSMLAVSPTATRDVAMYSATCRADCGAGSYQLYLTTDGGQHWALISSSSGNDAGSASGWVGTTFFANAAPAGTPHAPQQFLARSTDGGPFAWTTLPAVPAKILANGNTLYVITGTQASCAAGGGVCTDLWTSTDLGATWSHLTPTYQGNNVDVTAIATKSGTLYGYDARAFAEQNTYPMYRSTDGGHTWQPLPLLAGGLEANTDAIVAPDGTVFNTYIPTGANSTQQSGIYKLASGASAWQLVSPVVPAQVNLVAVQCDAAGHPVTLWGLAEASYATYSPWSHPA